VLDLIDRGGGAREGAAAASFLPCSVTDPDFHWENPMYRKPVDFSQVPAVGPIVLSADPTPVAVDLLGCNSASIQIAVGVGGITFSGTNKIEFKVTHSDDDSTYSDVTSSDVILGDNADTTVGTGGIVRSLIAAHAAATVARVDYIGAKRYLKILPDFSGTHGTGTPISVTVIKSRRDLKPSY
jgi:hypothetical protein